jgi:hypothetical protein
MIAMQCLLGLFMVFIATNPAHGEVYSIQHYVIQFVIDLRKVGGFLRVLRLCKKVKFTNSSSKTIWLNCVLGVYSEVGV